MDVSVYVRGGAGYGGWLELSDYVDVDDLVNDAVAATYDDGVQIIETESDYDLGDPLSLADVWDRMKVIGGSYEPEAMASYLSYHGWDLSVADQFDDAYSGLWDSLEDYALNYYEECYGELNIPGFRISVDIVAWQCDFFEVDTAGGVHIFRSI